MNITDFVADKVESLRARGLSDSEIHLLFKEALLRVFMEDKK